MAGGGAAGMMAAAAASEKCDDVVLIDKNEKLGKKLYITGKGRCNLTNACDADVFFDNLITNPKFLFSSFYGFDNRAAMDFFESCGLFLKTERGNRVFPVSDHSSDVIKALKLRLEHNNVRILNDRRLEDIKILDGRVCGLTASGEYMKADRLILALGGVSYKGTGATDDAFRLAKSLGLKTVPAQPSLVPLTSPDKWTAQVSGLSLKNVSVRLEYRKKEIFEGFGEMLFTHFGVSGPLILSASSYIKEQMYGDGLVLHIDLKDALTHKQLDERILRDFSGSMNKHLINSLDRLLPSGLIPVVIELAGLDPHKRVNGITRAEREALVDTIKDLRVSINGNRGFDEAIITRGGISVKEVDPSTMECRKIKGLYFAGEMLDVDALTGGFNLQIAWSTGHLAGVSAAKE